MRLYCKVLVITLAGIALTILPAHVSACPLISKLIDYNCDMDLRYGITGDSVVHGNTSAESVAGQGYAYLLAELLPAATTLDVAIPGVTTAQLLAGYKQNLLKAEVGPTKIRTRDLDLLIVDVGRNDYWNDIPAPITVRNIKRLVKFLRKALRNSDGVAPYIVVTTLIPSTRTMQQPFIAEVNRLLVKQRSSQLPVYLRLDQMPTTILSTDGLHPSAAGYISVATAVKNQILGPVQTLLKSVRPDKDQDGVYDHFEALFGVDPMTADTEGDGLRDGQELFTYFTDPTAPDTDEDGIRDAAEVAQGTDPLMPEQLEQ